MFERQGRCTSLCDIEFPQIESWWIRDFSDIAAHAWKDRGVGRFNGVRKQRAASDISIGRQLQHVRATMKRDDVTTVFGICLISSMALPH